MPDDPAVLAIGLKENVRNVADALIVKNSWGEIGLDDLGEPTADASQTGFFLITAGYLAAAEAESGHNGWSFVVPKKYLPKGK